MESKDFLKNFVKDKTIASIAPTPKSIVKKICSRIDFSKKNIIVEYGPGTGVFTKFILKHMNKNSKLIVIETNKNFVNVLKEIKDPRLRISNDTALNVKSIVTNQKADYVLSGIPFSFLTKEEKQKLLSDTRYILKEEGKFIVYQCQNLIKKTLKEYFVILDTDFKIGNIPPLFIFETKKK